MLAASLDGKTQDVGLEPCAPGALLLRDVDPRLSWALPDAQGPPDSEAAAHPDGQVVDGQHEAQLQERTRHTPAQQGIESAQCGISSHDLQALVEKDKALVLVSGDQFHNGRTQPTADRCINQPYGADHQCIFIYARCATMTNHTQSKGVSSFF